MQRKRTSIKDGVVKYPEFVQAVFAQRGARQAAEDATFENETRLNPEPAKYKAYTSVRVKCVRCLYFGPFHWFPGDLIRCPLCFCIGRKEAFTNIMKIH